MESHAAFIAERRAPGQSTRACALALHREVLRKYAADFPRAIDHLVELQDGTPVGRVLMADEDGAWRVVSFGVLAAYRGRGIGTEVIQQCQRDGATSGVDLHLRVAKGNPARKLYERLGFRVIRNDGEALEMIWQRSTTSKKLRLLTMPVTRKSREIISGLPSK